MKFRNRVDAGRQLAEVVEIKNTEESLVLALPRGGLPLGLEIAKKYNSPFDILNSKKIGHPSNSEYAIGAVSEQGDPLLNEDEAEGISSEWIEKEIKDLRKEMKRRRREYGTALEEKSIKNKAVIIVDDGIATGLTMKAAIKAVKSLGSRHIMVAVPVIPKKTHKELMALADDVKTLDVPDIFLGGVGAYYEEFPQVQDEEVVQMLKSYKENN